MLKINCGGILIPIAIEEFSTELKEVEKLKYQRVCDVECMNCGKIFYSQPYDSGKH